VSGATEPGRNVGREAADIASLADPIAWAPAAGRLLADLGFSLINSGRPDAPSGANLLVALRATPTLHHFDPEAVTYWTSVEGRGRPIRLDSETALPLEVLVSWGGVRVVDRLGVDNRFLTFGGTLRAVVLDDAESVAALRSPGPIARGGGHSQGLDPLEAEIGAFFGRLMVPVDFEAGAETRLAATPPLELYAAFIRDARDRLAAAAGFRTAETGFAGWVTAQAARLVAHEPEAWAAGADLLARLGIGRARR
jgi:hypothetical protein